MRSEAVITGEYKIQRVTSEDAAKIDALQEADTQARFADCHLIAAMRAATFGRTELVEHHRQIAIDFLTAALLAISAKPPEQKPPADPPPPARPLISLNEAIGSAVADAAVPPTMPGDVVDADLVPLADLRAANEICTCTPKGAPAHRSRDHINGVGACTKCPGRCNAFFEKGK